MRHIIPGLFLTIGCACLHAQTLDLRAEIPFPFRAGDKLMPAGDYTIHHSSGVLIIREPGLHTAALLLTNGGAQAHGQPTGSLVFHRYGERYFLAAILTPSPLDSRALPQSRAERAIARRTGPPDSVSIALGKP